MIQQITKSKWPLCHNLLCNNTNIQLVIIIYTQLASQGSDNKDSTKIWFEKNKIKMTDVSFSIG